jgi:hypothetical protein
MLGLNVLRAAAELIVMRLNLGLNLWSTLGWSLLFARPIDSLCLGICPLVSSTYHHSKLPLPAVTGIVAPLATIYPPSSTMSIRAAKDQMKSISINKILDVRDDFNGLPVYRVYLI